MWTTGAGLIQQGLLYHQNKSGNKKRKILRNIRYIYQNCVLILFLVFLDKSILFHYVYGGEGLAFSSTPDKTGALI